MTPLQLAVLQLAVPLAFALKGERPFLSWILLVNILVGLIVHRPVRSEHRELIDDVYRATLALWAVGVALSISDARIGQMVGGIAVILAGLQLARTRGCKSPVVCWIAYTAAAAATIVVVAFR